MGAVAKSPVQRLQEAGAAADERAEEYLARADIALAAGKFTSAENWQMRALIELRKSKIAAKLQRQMVQSYITAIRDEAQRRATARVPQAPRPPRPCPHPVHEQARGRERRTSRSRATTCSRDDGGGGEPHQPHGLQRPRRRRGWSA